MTRRGQIVGILGISLIGVALALGWFAFYMVGAALLAILLIALTNYLRSSEVSITRTILPTRVQRTALAISYLEIANRGQRRFWGAEASQKVGDQILATRLPRLRRGEVITRTVTLPTSRRGLFAVGPTMISHRDAFSLVEIQKPYGHNEALMVYPRIYPLQPVINALTQSLEGKTDDRSPNGSMTFHQLREYVPGDDIRKIHWKATARQTLGGSLIVRQDVDTAQPSTTIFVDMRPRGYSPDSFEMAIDFAASVVESCTLGRSPFQMKLTNGPSIFGSTRTAADRAMELLTTAQPDSKASLQTEMDSLGHGRGGAVLVVITGIVDDADVSSIANKRGQFSRVIIVSVTPEPRPQQHFAGIRVIQGSTESELIAAWNIGARR